MKPPLLQDIAATVRLAAPIVANQLAAVGTGVIEMLLAGHLGAQVLGAVAVGTNAFFLALMAMIGTMMAVSPSVAQLDGAGRRDEVASLFCQALWLAVALGLAAGGLLYGAAPRALAAIGVAPDLLGDATAYLHAISFSMPAISLYLACRGMSEGLSMPRPAMVLGLLELALLGPVGYGLMYGLGLGAFGLGLALTLMGWLALSGFAAFLMVSPRYRGLGWRPGVWQPDPTAILLLLRLGGPMAGSALLEAGFFVGASLLIARFGAVAVASHQIAVSFTSLVFMVPLGVAMATTVRVGRAIGRGDAAGVRRAGRIGLAMALASQSVACLLMLTMPRAIAGFYTGDQEVLGGAASLLMMAAMFQHADGAQVSASGALRGMKDTRLPMLLAGLSYWGVGLPVGLLFGFVLDWRTPGVWVGMIAGLSCAALLLWGRFQILAGKVAAPTG